jgi:hypothetical protein
MRPVAARFVAVFVAIWAALALVGCADGRSYLHVTVSGNVSGIDHFEVHLTNEGQTAAVTYRPADAPVALPFDFALQFDATRHGTVGVTVEAWSSDHLLASGTTNAEISPSRGTDVDVSLSPGSADGGADLAGQDVGVDMARDLLGATPLLGDTIIEPNTDPHSAGLADASNFIAATSGTVNSLTVYYDSGNATQLVIGLYNDLGGHPSTLLAVGTVDNPVPGTWNTASVGAAPVVGGMTYWIALVGPVGHGTAFSFRYGTGAGSSTSTEHSQQANLTTLPNMWTTGQTFPGTYCSFYASP